MLKRLIIGALILAILYGLGQAFVYGFDKTLDIHENTYYDKELGRMVYVEEGV